MRVIYDLCNFMEVVSFAGKSVKKIVVMDYCIDVCTGDNIPIRSEEACAPALITSLDISGLVFLYKCIFI